MRYTVASAINLLILSAGIVIGLWVSPHLSTTAKTDAVQGQVVAPSPGLQVGVDGQLAPPQNQIFAPIPVAQPKIESVQPSLSSGTVGFYLLLAHHTQSDELVVNGYDILKLQDAELSLISKFVPISDIQAAVNSARATTIYQVGAVQPPTPQSSAPSSPGK